MKRIASLVLLSSLLFTAACNRYHLGDEPPTEPPKNGVVSLETSRNTFFVENLLTWERLNSLPEPNSDMTTDELRQIVLDFAELSLAFQWTPAADFYCPDHDNHYRVGELFGGIPYDGYSGNPYKWMLYYDEETGLLDTSRVPGGAHSLFSDCSSFAYSAWAKVSNAMRWSVTPQINPAYGVLKLGEYQLDPAISNFKEQGIDTTDICLENGEQVMYRSYETLLPADGLVNYLPVGGHVLLVREVQVVRNATGIDGDESYAIILDQRGTTTVKKQADGTSYTAQAGIDRKLSFRTLYEKGYLPFGVPELYGLEPVEQAEASLSVKAGTLTVKELCDATLQSNYALLTVHVTVEDKDGTLLYRADSHISDHTMPYLEYALSKRLYPGSLGSFAGTGHRVTVQARVSTGEMLLAYEGELI